MPRRKRTDANGKSTIDTPPPGGPTADLERYVERLEALFTQKADAAEMIREVLAEAEDHGFHKKALQATVKRRLETADQAVGREAFEDSLEEMLSRLGMLRDLPLGAAAEQALRNQSRH